MCIVVWIESLQGFIKNQIIGRRRPRGLCKIETCCTDCIIRIHPHNITIRRHRRTSSQIMIIQLKYECLCQSILSNPATHFFFNKSIIKSIFSSDYVSKSNHTKLAPFFVSLSPTATAEVFVSDTILNIVFVDCGSCEIARLYLPFHKRFFTQKVSSLTKLFLHLFCFLCFSRFSFISLIIFSFREGKGGWELILFLILFYKKFSFWKNRQKN